MSEATTESVVPGQVDLSHATLTQQLNNLKCTTDNGTRSKSIESVTARSDSLAARANMVSEPACLNFQNLELILPSANA
jgi:hypothetical protein